jgi:hypothetical protein
MVRLGVAVLAVVVCGGCGRSQTSGYVAQNTAVLRSLATYPGAKLTTRYTVFVPKNGNTPRHGMYTTTHQFILPVSARCAPVLKWYRDMLAGRGWRLVERDLEFETFVRGEAITSTGCFTDERTTGKTLEGIQIDVNSHGR